MTHPVETSSATGAPRHGLVTEHSGASASSVAPSPRKLRGQSREEDIFYEELIRVLDGSDADQAVKHEVSDEYASNRSAFAQRLLKNTTAPTTPVRPAGHTFIHVVRATALVCGLLVLAFTTLVAIVLAAASPQYRVPGFVATVICIPLWGWIIRRIGTGRLSFWPTTPQLNDLQDAEAQYRDIVRVQITDHLNRVANRLHAQALAAEEETRRRAAEESAESCCQQRRRHA